MANRTLFVGKDIHKFSSAHMTVFPQGNKERLHGHNFQVSASFDLRSVEAQDFLDFAEVKSALTSLCTRLDQRLLLAADCPLFEILHQSDSELEFRLCGKRYLVPSDEVLLLPLKNIVVESLAEYFALELVQLLGPTIKPQAVEALTINLTESAHQGASFRWTWDQRP